MPISQWGMINLAVSTITIYENECLYRWKIDVRGQNVINFTSELLGLFCRREVAHLMEVWTVQDST